MMAVGSYLERSSSHNKHLLRCWRLCVLKCHWVVRGAGTLLECHLLPGPPGRAEGYWDGKATHDTHIHHPARSPAPLCRERGVLWSKGRRRLPLLALRGVQVVQASQWDIVKTDQDEAQTLEPVRGQEGVSEEICVSGDLHASPSAP